jgi:hypothetical protein
LRSQNRKGGFTAVAWFLEIFISDVQFLTEGEDLGMGPGIGIVPTRDAGMVQFSGHSIVDVLEERVFEPIRVSKLVRLDPIAPSQSAEEAPGCGLRVLKGDLASLLVPSAGALGPSFRSGQ